MFPSEYNIIKNSLSRNKDSSSENGIKNMMFGKPILLPSALPKVQSGNEKINPSYSKRMVVDLSQEYEEDMELLDMLNGNDKHKEEPNIKLNKNISQQTKKDKKINELETIQEKEDVRFMKKEAIIIQKKFLMKNNHFNNKGLHNLKNNTNNIKLNCSERSEMPLKKSKDLNFPLKPLYPNKKDMPILLIQDEKINSDSIPMITQTYTRQNLDQEKEKEEINKLLNLNQKLKVNNNLINSSKTLKTNFILPIFSSNKERNLNSASTSEHTVESNNNKKNVFEGKSIDGINKTRMNLENAYEKMNNLEEVEDTLININRRPLSNFNGMNQNLWKNIQKEGNIQNLDSIRNINSIKNRYKNMNITKKRNLSMSSNQRLSCKLNPIEFDENKKLYKIKIERNLLPLKVNENNYNKLNIDCKPKSLVSSCEFNN